MVEQLFNSVFAKYRDLSVSRWLIGSPLTNICQYFAQLRSRRKARENLCKRVTINIGLVFSSDWVRKCHELFRSHSNGVVMQTRSHKWGRRPRTPMIWDKFSIFRTNCATMTHIAARALSSPSRCFQLSTIVNKSWQRFLSLSFVLKCCNNFH